MIRITSVKINVKLLAYTLPFLGHSPPLLYINRNLALPSLCRALHKDGWGEGFEQREMWLGEDKVYISFWNSDNDYFLKLESEAFPEQRINLGMGGLN